ncbi:hypothetical protein PR048_024136 [Dryococelus australis]|uniref:DDE-1 domain-containing protein n=1 Tax=Dryococelus australis TaxID=614101 RepID=A0ABQ9GW17_9NEOP|nr:hypothetical protein PR048_024136 [Dryococelus australis]
MLGFYYGRKSLICQNYKQKFPCDGIVQANENGWMTSKLVVDWVRCDQVMLLYGLRVRTTEDVEKELKCYKSELIMIPGCMMSQLQPLNVCVNR